MSEAKQNISFLVIFISYLGSSRGPFIVTAIFVPFMKVFQNFVSIHIYMNTSLFSSILASSSCNILKQYEEPVLYIYRARVSRRPTGLLVKKASPNLFQKKRKSKSMKIAYMRSFEYLAGQAICVYQLRLLKLVELVYYRQFETSLSYA